MSHIRTSDGSHRTPQRRRCPLWGCSKVVTVPFDLRQAQFILAISHVFGISSGIPANMGTVVGIAYHLSDSSLTTGYIRHRFETLRLQSLPMGAREARLVHEQDTEYAGLTRRGRRYWYVKKSCLVISS